MTVLLVEDNTEILEIVVRYLDEIGLSTKTAGSAEEALEIMNEYSFDYFFIDIILPRMNGIELTKKILNKNKNAIITVMTGAGEGVDIVNQILLDAALDKGALYSLAKPFTFEQLKELTNQFPSF